MAITVFKSFVSTVTRFLSTAMPSTLRLMVDPTTGAPVGIQSQNAGGPDGIWTPIDITQAQALAPTALMLADINAVYRVNVAPYPRYRSDGSTALVPLDSSGSIVVPPGINEVFFSPLVVVEGQPLIIKGGVRVIQ